MRVSSRGQYGLRAMAYLATRHGEGPIRVRTVAEAEHLPAKYLEQLLARLRQAGLVRSSRGARGGIMLARAPEDITAREIIATLEGSLAPVECDESRSGHEQECTAHPLWSALHASVLQTLNSFTLADLAARCGTRYGASPVRREEKSDEVSPEPVEVGAGSPLGRTDVGS